MFAPRFTFADRTRRTESKSARNLAIDTRTHAHACPRVIDIERREFDRSRARHGIATALRRIPLKIAHEWRAEYRPHPRCLFPVGANRASIAALLIGLPVNENITPDGATSDMSNQRYTQRRARADLFTAFYFLLLLPRSERHYVSYNPGAKQCDGNRSRRRDDRPAMAER